MKNIKGVQYNIKQGNTILVVLFRELPGARLSEIREHYSLNNQLKVIIEVS